MNSRLLLISMAAALAVPAGAQMRSSDQMVRVCQDNIRSRAMDQFGTDDIRFDQINANRNGWVGGTVLVGNEAHRFSCSVNMNNGYIRRARIEGAPVAYNNNYQRGNNGNGEGYAGRDVMAGAMDQCRDRIADKIQDQGYFDVRVSGMNLDRDGDRISGFARANGQDHPESFSFSCLLDPGSGAVRSTSLIRR